MKLTEWAARRRIAAGAVLIALIVLGGYGFTKLPVDYLPNVAYPMIKVQIEWRGATPAEIEREIADPVERFVAAVEGLDYLESSSTAGLYSLTVHFRYGIDTDIAFQDVLAALTRVQKNLPSTIEAPYVFKADPSQLPVVQILATSVSMNGVELRDWVENWLQDRIIALPGVAGVDIVGGMRREIRIQLDPVALEKYGIAPQLILQRVAESNLDQSAGLVTIDSKELVIRVREEFDTLRDIEDITILRDGEKSVMLRDIAIVVDGSETQRMITRFNGRECVSLSVLREAEANTVRTAEGVTSYLREIGKSLPPGIQLGTTEDQAVYIRQSIDGVQNAAMLALALLVVVVYLFLGSIRDSLIMATALAATLVIQFGLMRVQNHSLNLFSLGGLVVAIGVILDNSIIVLENIRRMQAKRAGQEPVSTVVAATDQVAPALIAATLSFLALFFPFLILPGLTSLLFRELIFVMGGIVAVSLLLAVTITPMLARKMAGETRTGERTGWFQSAMRLLTNGYQTTVRQSMKRGKLIVLVSVVLVVVAFWLMQGLGGEFLPLVDDGRLFIKVKTPVGSSVGFTGTAVRNLERMVRADSLVQDVFSIAGGQVKGLTTLPIASEGELYIQMIPKSEREINTAAFVQRMRKKIASTQPPGLKIVVRQMPIKGIAGMRAADLTLDLRGSDMATLQKLARTIASRLEGVKSIGGVIMTQTLNRPEFHVRVDRVKAGDMGISIQDVTKTVQTYIGGSVASQYRVRSDTHNIRVIVDGQRLQSLTSLQELPVPLPGGGFTRLREIADIESTKSPVEIVRMNQVPTLSMEMNAEGVSLAAAVSTLQTILTDTGFPQGYTWNISGKSEMMKDMMNTAVLALGFAFFFSFIVLTVQFNNLVMPALALGSVPVALTGSIVSLYLFGIPLGATVIIGILVVVAAAVNDGVLLFTTADRYCSEKRMNRKDAVVRAATIRLRPRLMTTITTMMGFLPLALSIEQGGDMLRPMAVAAIGGLLMEIPVALYVMPALYVVFRRRLSE